MLETIKLILKNNNIDIDNVISIFKTGSQLISKDPKDRDYVVIVNKLGKETRHIYDKDSLLDLFIYDKEYYFKICSLEITHINVSLFLVAEAFKPNNTIYGDNTCNMKLLENAYKFKSFLQQRLSCYFSKNIRWKNSKVACAKKLWWAILGLMMIENNSYEVTDEMIDIANKCHNYELPKSWEDWVKERIYLLNRED